MIFATIVKKMSEKNSSTEYQDCLGCRIIGTATFAGLCGYSSYMLYTTGKNVGIGQRLFLGSLIVGTGYMAVFRALRP